MVTLEDIKRYTRQLVEALNVSAPLPPRAGAVPNLGGPNSLGCGHHPQDQAISQDLSWGPGRRSQLPSQTS